VVRSSSIPTECRRRRAPTGAMISDAPIRASTQLAQAPVAPPNRVAARMATTIPGDDRVEDMPGVHAADPSGNENEKVDAGEESQATGDPNVRGRRAKAPRTRCF
jgi:hypothetical protein